MNIFTGAAALFIIFAAMLGEIAIAQKHAGFDPNSIELKFRSSGLALVRRAKEAGVADVGPVPIERLEKALRETQVIVHPPNVEITVGDRESAQFDRTDKKRIFLNSTKALSLEEGDLEVLAVHEALGALGAPDEQYTLSIQLKRASLKSNSSAKRASSNRWILSEKQEKALEHMHNLHLISQNGGSTVVGGGGDGTEIRFKTAALDTIDELRSRGIHELDGLPLELLESSLLTMEVRPRRDMGESHAWVSFDQEQTPIVYVKRNSLKSRSSVEIALQAARAHALVVPEAYGGKQLSPIRDWKITLDTQEAMLELDQTPEALAQIATAKLITLPGLTQPVTIFPFHGATIIAFESGWLNNKRNGNHKHGLSEALHSWRDRLRAAKPNIAWRLDRKTLVGHVYAIQLSDAIQDLIRHEHGERASTWAIVLSKVNFSYAGKAGDGTKPLVRFDEGPLRHVYVDVGRWSALNPESRMEALRRLLLESPVKY